MASNNKIVVNNEMEKMRNGKAMTCSENFQEKLNKELHFK
jgi:hypothetical protein